MKTLFERATEIQEKLEIEKAEAKKKAEIEESEVINNILLPKFSSGIYREFADCINNDKSLKVTYFVVDKDYLGIKIETDNKKNDYVYINRFDEFDVSFTYRNNIASQIFNVEDLFLKLLKRLNLK